MAETKWRDQQVLTEKVSAYLETHHKITTDFERSLRGARHYVELAKLARDKEPEETAALLEQIREIDLLGHLQTQLEAFEDISGFLPSGEAPAENEPSEDEKEGINQIQEIRNRYDVMLEEAEDQQEAISELMLYLQNMA